MFHFHGLEMKEIIKTASILSSCKTDQEKIDQLCHAFTLFSKQTVRLESAYISLQEQFKQLNDELRDTHRQLQTKAAEFDIMTGYLKSILGNIVQGILFIDLNGIVTTYNKAAETILGVPSRQVLFQDFWQNFSDDTFGFSMHDSLEQKKASDMSCISYSSPLHHQCDLEVVTTFIQKPLLDEETNLTLTPTQGLIVMLRDVTEMHHLQTIANRSDRMKVLGEMAAQVAHEIRNPLGGIKGFASLLQRDLTEHPQMQQMATYIVEGTDNLNRLVSQILLYARPVQPHLEKIDLMHVLKELQQHVMADDTILRQNIKLVIEGNQQIPLMIDPSLFKSALLNLVVNAAQAMPDGGTIDINVQQKQGQVILTITDTGIGISEEHLSKLYSPFFTTKTDGNGLGLAETQKVVQAHGGRIDVSSIINQGTTFVIKLPLNQR